MSLSISDKISDIVRIVPDFPKPGIDFFDITTLLKTPGMLAEVSDAFAAELSAQQIDTIVGIEARGFVFGAALAQTLGVAFIPVRKPGKLPFHTESISYLLEYGQDTLEVHRDAIENGHRVVIVDDLLATGGTAAATAALVKRLGATLIAFAFVIELDFLNARQKLSPTPCISLHRATE